MRENIPPDLNEPTFGKIPADIISIQKDPQFEGQIPDFDNAPDRPTKKEPYITVSSTETEGALNSSLKNDAEVLEKKRRVVLDTFKGKDGKNPKQAPSVGRPSPSDKAPFEKTVDTKAKEIGHSEALTSSKRLTSSYEAGLKRHLGTEPEALNTQVQEKKPHMPPQEMIDGVTSSKIIEGKKENNTKAIFFDTRFTEKFGITQEDIASIEGFDVLSKAQQKLVFENLTQLTLGSVREEASRLCHEKNSTKREKTVSLLGKRLGGAVVGFREAFTTVYQTVKTEKNVAEKMRTGGLQQHKEMLTQLVGSIAKYGPRVHETMDGELMVDLLNIHERAQGKEYRKEEWYAMNELNSVAHAFARIPAEWRGHTLGLDTHKDSKIGLFFREKILRSTERKDREEQATRYSDAETRFIIAKKSVEASFRKSGKSDAEIAQIMVGLDSRVHQLQIIQTNPDALKALEEVEGKNIYLETAKGMMGTTGLGYLALGFVGRSVLGAGLGIIGAPLVSASIASMRSWDRTSAELRERDRNARMGVGDTHDGALNIVSSNHLVERTTRLIEQIHQAEGDTKVKLLASLKARAEYIHDKQALHRVDYGLRNGSVTEQTRLTETLGEALALLASEDMLLNDANTQKRFDAIDQRLHLKLKNTEQRIIDTRHAMRFEDRDSSVKKAALFSLAGALFADKMLASDTPQDGIKNASASSTHIYKSDANEYFKTNDESFNGAPLKSVSSAPVEQISSAKTLPPYTILEGDTLTDILREEIPAVTALSNADAQNNAIENIIRSLTPEQMKDIGIQSDNVHHIFAGDTINLQKLNEIVTQKHAILESAETRFGDRHTEVTHSTPEVIPDAQNLPVESTRPQIELTMLSESPKLAETNVESQVPAIDTEEVIVSNSRSFQSPYGMEKEEVVQFRMNETEAFLNGEEKSYTARRQRLLESDLDQQSRAIIKAHLESSFMSYTLAMKLQAPYFSFGEGTSTLRGSTTGKDQVLAAEYLMEQIKDRENTPFVTELRRLLKQKLINKKFAENL